MPVPVYSAAFEGRVSKISQDEQGTRLTYIKVTGGRLKAKTLLKEDTASGE